MMEEGEISEDSVTVEIPSIPSTPKRPLHVDLEEKDDDAHKKKYPKTFKISYKRSYVGCSSIEDYRLVKKCGEGTFGQVYMAKHRKTSELVAIKRMFCHKQDEDGFPITALREIKYLKFLKHPNIISVSNVVYSNDVYGKDIDSFYVVFPYMDHDLTGLLGNPAVKFTTQQIKYYMVEILKGLSYLHSKRLLHRDIKSSNILLNNEGAVKLADFGLAQQYCEIRKEYTPGVVTQWYRSPELLFGATAYTSAVDMWGIGCIFGEFFKRSPIFNGKSEIGQLELICEMCGTPSEENWPGVSKLPNFATLNLTFNRRRVKESFLKYGESFADLMDSLLQLNPADRITAEEALNHKYFSEIPWPAKKSDLPKYHSMHEIDVKKDSQRSSPGWQHRGSQSTNEGRRRDDRNYDFYKQRHRL